MVVGEYESVDSISNSEYVLCITYRIFMLVLRNMLKGQYTSITYEQSMCDVISRSANGNTEYA